MNIVDLTHLIRPDMPVYPGTEGPKLSPANTVERDGFCETLLTMYSHTGTHMDAPAHLFMDRPTLDAFPASAFCGTALTIDCSKLTGGARITMDRIRPRLAEAEQADFLLFFTGWSRHWGRDAYFDGFPVMAREVAEFLIRTKKKGVGLDAISVDAVGDAALPIHKLLLKNADIVIVENLVNLEQTLGAPFTFFSLPLKYANADGAPARVVALLG